MMGILGAMSGVGAQAGDIGSTMFKSAMEEERSMRIAEYKGQADAAAADTKYARDKELAEYEAGLKGDKPTVVGKGGALVDKSGKELYRNPDDGSSSDPSKTKGLVKLKNGQAVDESDMVREYSRQWILRDEYGMERQREGAPDFESWRNSLVADEYKRTSQFGAGTEGQVTMDEARKQAAKEAEKKDPLGPNFLRGDAMKEAYGPEGKDPWIEKRAAEIVRESGTAPGGQQPQTIQAVEPKFATQDVTQGGAPPKAALEKLSPGKITTFTNGQKWTIKDGKPVRVE